MDEHDRESPTERPIVNLAGETVGLGPLRRDLIPLYHRWSNDLAGSATAGVGWPATLEQEQATYDRRTVTERESHFTIYELPALRPIGVCGLSEIDHKHGRATFAITIGAADSRGRGFGAEATRLTLDYAFTALGLSNVMLTCSVVNAGGLRAYTKAGFREFGRRRRCSRVAGRVRDLVYMECLAEEFVSPVLARVFAPDESRA